MNQLERDRLEGIRNWALRDTHPDWHNGSDIRFLIRLIDEQEALLQRTAGVIRDLTKLAPALEPAVEVPSVEISALEPQPV